MPHPRGCTNKRKRLARHYDSQLQRSITASKHGITHTYSIAQIQPALHQLHAEFRDRLLPLANGVAKPSVGTERPGPRAQAVVSTCHASECTPQSAPTPHRPAPTLTW